MFTLFYMDYIMMYDDATHYALSAVLFTKDCTTPGTSQHFLIYSIKYCYFYLHYKQQCY